MSQNSRPRPWRPRAIPATEVRNLAIDDMCFAAARTVGGDTALTLGGRLDHWETVCATGERAHYLEELQLITGEGPTVESIRSGDIAGAGNLGTTESAIRWPAFGPAAAETGATAAFAFPLHQGHPSVGALTVYRNEPGELDEPQREHTLRLAGLALSILTVRPTGPTPDDTTISWPSDPNHPDHDPTVIYQATGVLAAQCGVDVNTAFAILRAQAYGTGARLGTVARAIIATYLPLDERAQIR